MKTLEISEEIEKHLISVIDHALKSGGFAIYASVQAVVSSVKEKIKDLEEQKNNSSQES